jgi:alpha-galactosidase
MSLSRLVFAFAALACGSASAQEAASCAATLSGNQLTIANRRIERRWRVEKGLLYATSFRDLGSGVEWLARPSRLPAPTPDRALPAEERTLAFTAKRGRFGAVQSPSLIAELTAAGKVTLRYTFQIFPDSPGVRMRLSVEGMPPAPAAATQSKEGGPSGVEGARPVNRRAPLAAVDALESLEFAPPHLRLTEVTLVDQTDAHNELVFEKEWLLHTTEKVEAAGNLFLIENPLTGAGLILLKEAPLPHARFIRTDADLRYDPAQHRALLYGNGLAGDGEGYRYVTLAYSGGRAGRIAALHRYQRDLRNFDPARDGLFLSNTWGDRNRDSRIAAAFMAKEIEAGARLGVDVIQIDDGWQKGRTANSAQAKAGSPWNGFWAADPNFWDVDRGRFPNGLAPVIEAARARRMQFGLWFAPDSSRDFANWERDAARILELHRTLGVRYFKIDGVKAITREAERNLRRFFDRVLEETRGAVTFDLDVTAEIRPGYFGVIDVGPLFVENRYTDWRRYWPHQTLRNLWKLAQYVDPLRLRMEFLNNARNQERYPDDPLGPAAYAPATLFATAMMANPLGWFEISSLPPAYAEQLPPLVAAWKKERAAMHGGLTLPIGEAPDGVAWTGFASLAENRRGGYLLLFREANASAAWSAPAEWLERGAYRVERLGGAGQASLVNGRLQASIPARLGFLWVRVTRAR